MSHREFRDEAGRAWEVWDVHPSGLEAPQVIDGVSFLAHVRTVSRLNLPTEMRDGWLAFRSGTESRRLAPIPTSWVALADQDLALLVHAAKPSARVIPRS